jgi:hypothetical protein
LGATVISNSIGYGLFLTRQRTKARL